MFTRLTLLTLVTLISVSATAQRGERLAPPDALDCERENLTSFEGTLLSFESGSATHRIVLKTDWDSEESFDVSQLPSGEPRYLLNGAPMTAGEWKTIIPDPTSPPDGLRLIVWVCECPGTVVIDWRPQAH
jgi:hypothetical protein